MWTWDLISHQNKHDDGNYGTRKWKQSNLFNAHITSAQRHWSASVFHTSLFLPKQQSSCSAADTTAVSDAVLIEKLINFFEVISCHSHKSDSCSPPPETNCISVLMAGDPLRGYMGTFGHWKCHLWSIV